MRTENLMQAVGIYERYGGMNIKGVDLQVYEAFASQFSSCSTHGSLIQAIRVASHTIQRLKIINNNLYDIIGR